MSAAGPAPVTVARVRVERLEVDVDPPTAGAEVRRALAAVAGAPGYRPPLAPERVTLEIAGVPAAVPNALRRAAKEEVLGRCLTFDPGRLETTDPFMTDAGYVLTRVRMVPLRPQISEGIVKGLRLALDVSNATGAAMSVYAGDLTVVAGELDGPLFNPTHELAFLQPGRVLRISDIRIAEGYGSQDAAFAMGVRAVARPLDLPEAPRAETHAEGGARAGQSGFLVSALEAAPRRHELSVVYPAAPPGGRAALTALVDVCASLVERLHFVRRVLEGGGEGASRRHANASYIVTPGEDRMEAVLSVRGENDTIGCLLARYVCELKPDISYAAYRCIPHEKEMRLVVAHPVPEPKDLEPIISAAVARALDVLGQIQRGIRAALP